MLCICGGSFSHCDGFCETDIETLPHYGSVNSSILDMTRQRSHHSSSGMSEDKNSVVIDRMRRRLRFFFMNPLEKWQTKRQFPYKLTIQLVKIFFVTTQVNVMGHSNLKLFLA